MPMAMAKKASSSSKKGLSSAKKAYHPQIADDTPHSRLIIRNLKRKYDLIRPSIHPSIDLPLVALIIKVSSATCNAYNRGLSPKIFQNPSKISKNRFKIASKIVLKSEMRSRRGPNTIFFNF